MKCYLCENLAEYSCNCAIPIILICHDHLKIHKQDKRKKHTLDFLEDVIQINIFNEIRNKLRKINEEIILNSENQIKQIIEETKQILHLINRVAQNLHDKYLEKSLKEKFLEESRDLIANDIDEKMFRNYILIENDELIEN